MILFDISAAYRDNSTEIIGPPRSGKSTFLTYCDKFPSCRQAFPECLSKNCSDKEKSLQATQEESLLKQGEESLLKRLINSFNFIKRRPFEDKPNFYLDEVQGALVVDQLLDCLNGECGALTTTDGKKVTGDLLIGSLENIYKDETGLDLPNLYQLRDLDKERVKEDVLLYSTVNWHGIKYVNPRLILLSLAHATHDANYRDKLREHMLFSKKFLSALGLGAIFTESLFTSGEEIGLDSTYRISKDIVPSVLTFLGGKLLHLGGVISTIVSGGSTIAFLLPVVLLLSFFERRKEKEEFTENLIELIERWKKNYRKK